jgi:hypothetical protein
VPQQHQLSPFNSDLDSKSLFTPPPCQSPTEIPILPHQHRPKQQQLDAFIYNVDSKYQQQQTATPNPYQFTSVPPTQLQPLPYLDIDSKADGELLMIKNYQHEEYDGQQALESNFSELDSKDLEEDNNYKRKRLESPTMSPRQKTNTKLLISIGKKSESKVKDKEQKKKEKEEKAFQKIEKKHLKSDSRNQLKPEVTHVDRKKKLKDPEQINILSTSNVGSPYFDRLDSKSIEKK